MRVWHLTLLVIILIVLIQMIGCTINQPKPGVVEHLPPPAPPALAPPPPVEAQPDTTGGDENAPDLTPPTPTPTTDHSPKVVPNCDRPRPIPVP